LVLRDARANPDKGLLFELYQASLVEVTDPYLRFRGIEQVTLGRGEVGAMVQEWLVRLRWGTPSTGSERAMGPAASARPPALEPLSGAHLRQIPFVSAVVDSALTLACIAGTRGHPDAFR
jgi:hypothetical protein